MKTLELTKGAVAIVDDEDYERLSKYKWSINCQGYAVRGFRVKGVNHQERMHRAVIGNPPTGYVVDHINGNRTDNRKCNLRFVTYQQNIFNARPKQITGRAEKGSAYKGVSWFKRDKCWRARIFLSGKEIHLGLFASEREAALAYNKAALKYHGEYARLNDI